MTRESESERPSRTQVSGPGFGGLLRSLFSRMPWGESASRNEVLVVPAPSGRAISVHNANGKTRVVGEDREDIEIRVHKSVRADCADLATKLLDAIRVQSSGQVDVLEIEVQIPRKCSKHAVAHLDHATAEAILADLTGATHDRTVVMVSHRDDGFSGFDHIIDLTPAHHLGG